MPDHARSDDAAVQAQLNRLWALSPGADILGLGRITELLARLGDPHRRLPPVLHVAGTNGKGSTCAFLRTALESAGGTVHAYTSPHLVRFNERIRLAGRLVDDVALAVLLGEVLDQADGLSASFFEVTTAAAFLAFSRVPADACVIEVGLGGRLDATNILAAPAATGIAALGIDHESFLGDQLVTIAAEKAGIAKPGVPLVTMDYPPPIAARVAAVAAAAGAPTRVRGRDWDFATRAGRLVYRDAAGSIDTPLPALFGAHQAGNLALAIAMLRHQAAIPLSGEWAAAAARRTTWPARMQRLAAGPLLDLLPAGADLWLDGAHNPSAAAPVAMAFRTAAGDRPRAAVIGMLASKDAAGVLSAFTGVLDRIVAVPVPGHDHHDPDALAAIAGSLGIEAAAAPTLADALTRIGHTVAAPPAVLIMGSLYLAGEALAANDQAPI